MEGISIHLERTDFMPSSHMKTDIFKSMRRSVSDLSPSPRKGMEKAEIGSSQSRFGGNQVSVVSVQYDVPKAPPAATVFRFRKMHTPVSTPSSFHRAKSDDKINNHTYLTNVPEYPLKLSARLERRVKEQKEEKKILQETDQLAGNIEAHRLKGLGVGKCYMEYRPPPTAPEGLRSGTTEGLRSGVTPATTPGLMCQTPSTNPSGTPSQLSRLDQANMKFVHMRQTDMQIKSAQNYLHRAKSFLQDERLLNNKSQSQHTFNPSPLLHSQNLNGKDHGAKGQGRQNQGFRGLTRQNPPDLEQAQRFQEKDISYKGERDPVYRGYSFHERDNIRKIGNPEREQNYKSSVSEREHSYKSAKQEREHVYKISYHEREPSHKSVSQDREHGYNGSMHHEGYMGEIINGEAEGHRLRHPYGSHLRNGDLDEEMFEYNK